MLLRERADDVFHDGGILRESFKKIAPRMKRLRHACINEAGAGFNLFSELLDGNDLCALLCGTETLRFASQQINRVVESFNQSCVEERALSYVQTALLD